MREVDRASAVELARKRIAELAQEAGDEFEMLSDATREVERGWVFFYNTLEYVQTKNPLSALAGNGPILVTREGAVHDLPSAIAWEAAVKRI